jgi:hypothetical protein
LLLSNLFKSIVDRPKRKLFNQAVFTKKEILQNVPFQI